MPRGGKREGAGTPHNVERTSAIYARFQRLIAAGERQSDVIADLAEYYGVLRPAIWKQIHKARSPQFAELLAAGKKAAATICEHAMPVFYNDAAIWCGQCEKRVSPQYAGACSSPFCKARVASGMEARQGQDPAEGLDGEAVTARPDAQGTGHD